ncbi:MAG: cytochrome c biogenesis protein ResB [Candidatus Omnitrophica bacterium]|nr:cytochrome c biogenesis protein ResB [Candidatus Omnitrophota bacterium]
MKKLGSLSFTVFICLFLIMLLIVSTTMESKYGTDMAQKVFYQSKWFDCVLALLWLNIFCSTVLRFPFKKKHIGFLITHASILALLIGALMSRTWGVEGQMLLFEGDTRKAIANRGYFLDVVFPNGTKVEWPLMKAQEVLPVDTLGAEIKVGRIFDFAKEEEVVLDQPGAVTENRAIQVTLKSDLMNLEEQFWLVEDHPFNPHGNFKTIGPASFYLKKGTAEKLVEKPTLEISNSGGSSLSIEITENMEDSIALMDLGLTIENIQYFKHAVVSGRELMEGPQGSGYNPAVKFHVVDQDGNRHQVIRFALFPDFESMHGDSISGTSKVTYVFNAPGADLGINADGSTLTFYYWPGDVWSFKAVTKDGHFQEGEIRKGDTKELEWADFNIHIDDMLKSASVTTRIVRDDKGKKGPFAVEIVVQSNEQTFSQWVVESQKVGFHAKEGDYKFMLKSNAHELPFALTLNEFRKIDYPGTTNPASFESDVTLRDLESEKDIQQTIKMNQPMDYKGYRIFQMSYIQNDQRGEGSVFTIAKKPGITLIYLSSFAIFFGAFCQFYLKKEE